MSIQVNNTQVLQKNYKKINTGNSTKFKLLYHQFMYFDIITTDL